MSTVEKHGEKMKMGINKDLPSYLADLEQVCQEECAHMITNDFYHFQNRNCIFN